MKHDPVLMMQLPFISVWCAGAVGLWWIAPATFIVENVTLIVFKSDYLLKNIPDYFTKFYSRGCLLLL